MPGPRALTRLTWLVLALSVLGVACGPQSSTSNDTAETTDANDPNAETQPVIVASATSVRTEVDSVPASRPAIHESAPPPAPEFEPEPVAVEPEPRFVMVDVPAGTALEVELIDTLSSGANQVGDPVRAMLTTDLFAGGTLVAYAGAELAGSVTDVVPLKKFGGRPSISLAFASLSLAEGYSVPVLTSHTEEGKKQAGRDAAKIGGGAAIGAILGHQTDNDRGKELGALVGGAIGTAIAAKTGKEIELTSGTTITVLLESDVRIRVER